MADGREQACDEGDEALSSTLWSGGRSRAWTTHLASCAFCSERQRRVDLASATARKQTPDTP